MTIFKISDIEIDGRLTALVQVGQWDNDGDRDRGLRPQSKRALWVQLDSLSSENYSLLESLVAGHDWLGSKTDGDYIFTEVGGIVERQPEPSPHHVFNYTTKQWEDPRTLSDLKAAKNAAINQARAKANSGFFLFQSKRIAADPLSRSDIDAAHGSILMLQALPPGWPGGWKSMDNEIVLIPDVATWAQFYGTMVATGTANFNHSQTLKAQLAAASTPAEVEAVPEW